MKKQEKLPARPQKRSTSHLPTGEETPNVWTSGRRKRKPLVRIQLVYKHRQPTLTLLKMKQRKPTSTTATPKPSIFQQYRQKKSERSTQTRCTYTGSLPKPTKSVDPDDPALVDRSPEYTPDKDIVDRPPTPTREICSGRRPNKKKKYLSAIPEQGRRT